MHPPLNLRRFWGILSELNKPQVLCSSISMAFLIILFLLLLHSVASAFYYRQSLSCYPRLCITLCSVNILRRTLCFFYALQHQYCTHDHRHLDTVKLCSISILFPTNYTSTLFSINTAILIILTLTPSHSVASVSYFRWPLTYLFYTQ